PPRPQRRRRRRAGAAAGRGLRNLLPTLRAGGGLGARGRCRERGDPAHHRQSVPTQTGCGANGCTQLPAPSQVSSEPVQSVVPYRYASPPPANEAPDDGTLCGKGEFGHVRVDHLADEITLCVYDYAAGVPSLAFSASVLAGDVCDGGPCWT